MMYDQKLNDLDVLVHRALLGKKIDVFGEDAFGRNYYQQYFSTIAAVASMASPKPIERIFQISGIITYAVEFRLVKLDCSLGVLDTTPLDNAKLVGDRNLHLGLRRLFNDVSIPHDAWTVTPNLSLSLGGVNRTTLVLFTDKITF
jgi:hypothetical protein